VQPARRAVHASTAYRLDSPGSSPPENSHEDSWVENGSALLSLAAGIILLLAARAETARLRSACFLAAGVGFIFVTDLGMHDLADLVCWLGVVATGVLAFVRKQPGLVPFAILTALGAPLVIYLNHLNSARAAINTVSEAQEYLFLCLCLAYSLELLRYRTAVQSRPAAA
jgi:hypothetical protein